MEDTGDNDERISQFLAVTGSSDAAKAVSYLEMSGNNVETAVALYMDHEQGSGGSGGGAGASGIGGGMGGAGAGFGLGDQDGIRAPDETRRMQLMEGPDTGGAGFHPAFQMMNELMQAQLDQPSAFASPLTNRANRNNRAVLDEAIAAQGLDYMDDSAMDEEEDDEEETKEAEPPRLSDMFAPPTHIMHTAGGFQGARTMAKDSKRWLLVNIQRDAEFASHALNRDVWRDELVENLVREGFIFWQQMDTHPDGQTYCQRYKVYSYPHIAIIDPRTGRLMWSKEGWTLENPVTAETFSEMAMDFCSRFSLDRPPEIPRIPQAGSSGKRPAAAQSEADQLQAALRASMAESGKTAEDDDDADEFDYEDDVEVVEEDHKPPPQVEKKESLAEQLKSFTVPDEPSNGARMQVRLPDGKRLVRKFNLSDSVRTVYAFIVQSNEEASTGRGFGLMAGYPPRDLIAEIDNSVEDAKLTGQAITMRWKD